MSAPTSTLTAVLLVNTPVVLSYVPVTPFAVIVRPFNSKVLLFPVYSTPLYSIIASCASIFVAPAVLLNPRISKAFESEEVISKSYSAPVEDAFI